MSADPIPEDLDSRLGSLLQMALETVPDACGASVTMVALDAPSTLVTSADGAARRLDEAQYAQGHGPCLDAALSGDVVVVTDARTELRWPSYIPVAVRNEVQSSVSAPIPLPSSRGASLNVYRTGTVPITTPQLVALARLAAVAGASMATSPDGRIVVDADAAVAARSTMDQARGILMARHGGSAEDAFARLRSTSQDLAVPIQALAEDLVRSTRT